MICEESKNKMPLMLDQSISLEDKLLLLDHFQSCTSCMEEWQQLSRADEWFQSELTEIVAEKRSAFHSLTDDLPSYGIANKVFQMYLSEIKKNES